MDKKLLVVGVIVVLVLGAPFVLKMLKQDEAAPSANTQDTVPAMANSAPPAAAQNVDPNIPTIVSMQPLNGATDVSSSIQLITVTFDRPMGGGFSWTGGGEHYPETTGEPYWSTDRKTCCLPVALKPNWNYKFGLNSQSFKNFKSEQGYPLTPVVWIFSTAAQ